MSIRERIEAKFKEWEEEEEKSRKKEADWREEERQKDIRDAEELAEHFKPIRHTAELINEEFKSATEDEKARIGYPVGFVPYNYAMQLQTKIASKPENVIGTNYFKEISNETTKKESARILTEESAEKNPLNKITGIVIGLPGDGRGRYRPGPYIKVVYMRYEDQTCEVIYYWMEGDYPRHYTEDVEKANDWVIDYIARSLKYPRKPPEPDQREKELTDLIGVKDLIERYQGTANRRIEESYEWFEEIQAFIDDLNEDFTGKGWKFEKRLNREEKTFIDAFIRITTPEILFSIKNGEKRYRLSIYQEM